MKIKIGTRGSKLALAQCDEIINLLNKKYKNLEFEKIIIKTKGDTDNRSLNIIGGNWYGKNQNKITNMNDYIVFTILYVIILCGDWGEG